MPAAQRLRQFITERLTAAAQEIFSEFERTIVRYEEEIERQRRQLDVTWRPGTDLPQQEACKEEEEVLTEQQLRETSFSVDPEEPEPPQIKEEQEGEQPGVKEEAEALVLTEEHSEAEPNTTRQLSSAEAQRRRLEGRKIPDCGPSWSGDRCQRTDAEESSMSDSQRSSDTGEKSITCDVCGKSFRYNSRMKRHYSTHTGLKPYACDMCGKSFSQRDNLTVHMRIHTGEKPYPCNACGKKFTIRSNLLVHMRIHTGEKPSSCKTCGKMFRCHSHLWRHRKIHTRQKS